MRAAIETGKLVEVAAIASLVLISVYAELEVSIFSTIGKLLVGAIPGFQSYGAAVFASMWMGLCVYVFARKRQLQREIAARERTEEAFEDYKISDVVTGLPNRFAFDLVISERLGGSDTSNYSILGIELTNQEAIHSVHGEVAIADIRTRLSECIVDVLDQTDFIAAEGDKFYIFVSTSSREERRTRIETVAAKTLQMANSGRFSEDSRFQISLVFAIIDLAEEMDGELNWSGTDVLRRVDFLLQSASRQGHGTIEVYGCEVEEELNRRALIEVCLADAINDHQIIPYFQPLIDLQIGRVIGLEVLSRWTHPLLGPISPVTFIPIAQEVGLSHSLTLSVMRQACRAASAWPDDIKIAVNVSPTDLRNERAVNALLEVLDESGIDQTRMELEITENDVIEEVDNIRSALYRFKDRGVSISIDDFGTGYSSLHHLRLLPFDKIKIDQSFVREMDSCPENHKIVRTVIALAQSLGLQTTAEGIEGTECQELLQDLGCTIGQGFLYARPLPASDVADFIEKFDENQRKLQAAA